MSLTDPIADMLTKIRNAGRAKHPNCKVFKSKLKIAVLDILKDEVGFDLRGIWYLSWEYYDVFIPDTQKIMDMKISKTNE